MWSIVNSIFNFAFDVLLWPFRTLSPAWGACVLGVPAAVLALLVFRYSSNQAGIGREKDRIWAYLLELLLYKDDLKVTLRAQLRLLRHNLAYFGHSLRPMAVMILPFALAVVQVESRYAYRPLARGESTILAVRVEGEAPVSDLPASLSLPEGLVQETPPLRIDESGEILWRIRADQPGEHRVEIQVGASRVEKRVVVRDAGRPSSPVIYRSTNPAILGYPAEPPLESGTPVSSVRVDYPVNGGRFAGLSSSSWVFFAASLVFGLLFKGPLGVKI